MTALQIRNVPDELLDKLKAKANSRGQSLSEWALGELRIAADRLTLEEALAQIKEEKPIRGSVNAAAIIREERDAR